MKDPTAAYEPRDVDVSLAFASGLAIVVLLALALIGLRVMLVSGSYRDAAMTEAPAPERDAGFPEPRLQAYPRSAGRDFRRRAAAELTTYGWADRTHGQARIPIARAMELLAAGRPELE